MREPQRIFTPSLRVPQAGTATTLPHLSPPQEEMLLWESGRWARAERKLLLLYSSGSSSLFVRLYPTPLRLQTHSPLWQHKGSQAVPTESCPPRLGLGSMRLGLLGEN